MRKFLFSFAALFFLSLAMFAEGGKAKVLRLWLTDGTSTLVQLYTCPVVTFSGGQIHVVSPVAELHLPVASVERFTYEDIKTGIQKAESEGNFRQEGNVIVFDSSVKSDAVKVFGTDGKQLPVRLSRNSSGGYALSLSALPVGVYVISVNGVTSKIVKR